MVYSGGFFDAANANYLNFVDAFAGSNASVGLPQRQHQAASDSFTAYSGRGWHPEEAHEERQCPRQREG